MPVPFNLVDSNWNELVTFIGECKHKIKHEKLGLTHEQRHFMRSICKSLSEQTNWVFELED